MSQADLNFTEKTALSEHDAKNILKRYGVPVVPETVATETDQAVAAAEAFGFPVVVKGLGATLMHKTEAGIVHLNLGDGTAVRDACRRIVDAAGSALEGFLVQPHVQGKREFVAGLFHDRVFGPVVMFGLGGIFTEALADITFRVAPLTEIDAGEMIDEIRATRLLGAFRGDAPADRRQLIDTLMGLSEIGQKEPDIAEVDINPLIITPEGKICAVDALIVKGGRGQERPVTPPVDPKALGKLFYPRSIAFVGASGQMGKWGHLLFTNTVANGYEGEIYLVNPTKDIIAGRKTYKSVNDIPGPVDLAVVTVPAAGVSDLIPDLAKKGIRSMLLITSGFAEVGPEGKALEKNVMEKAREAGILVIGPNTMGIINPHIRLYCTGSLVWPDPGGIAVVAQSGNMGGQLLHFAEQQGIEIRAFCGSGNEGMVTIEDYLEGFEIDDVTKIVMLYIESVKNGQRFLESARRLSRRKPIVMLKGGQTEAGSRAAASHTGAMTSDARVFEAVCRQTGIIKVDRTMDMLDLSAAFSSLPLPKGKRVAIMTLGGGWGVVASDLCASFNLEVPQLSPELIETINGILPPYWSHANPVDLVGERDNSFPVRVIEELIRWDGCDMVLNLGILGRKHSVKRLIKNVVIDPNYTVGFGQQVLKAMYEFEESYIAHIVKLMETYEKPVIGVNIVTDETEDKTLYKVDGARYKGVFFPTPERAVKSLAKMYDYSRFLLREQRR
ncbi:MAG: acetate--CoA ligase family protein [Thermodesulfobacteriota bacterium]